MKKILILAFITTLVGLASCGRQGGSNVEEETVVSDTTEVLADTVPTDSL